MSGSDGGLTGRRQAKRKIMRSSVEVFFAVFPWGTCMMKYQLVTDWFVLNSVARKWILF